MPPADSRPSAPAADLAALVTGVFTAWNEQGVPFVVLRNYEGLPHTTSHDIDVLLHPRHHAVAERLLVIAARNAGYRLTNRAEFATTSLFFYHPETLGQVQFDLFQSLNWRGFPLLSATAVINWRIAHGPFAIPHPIHEAVNDLLTRLIYHGYVKENYKPIIAAVFNDYPQEGETTLRRLFGRTVGKALADAILRRDWSAVEAQTRAMRRQLILRCLVFKTWETLTLQAHDLRRFTRRLFQPPGAKVVLLGADGSGKSSVATRLGESLHGTFYRDKSVRIHWKPAIFSRRRRAGRAPVTDPHAQPPRGWLVSQLLLAGHWLEYFAGSLFHSLPVLFRSGLVLIERHHYDFLVDPRRYRLQPPGALLRFAFRRLRRPDLVFLLDAPAEVLHARKPELTLEATRQQRDAYRQLILQLPNARMVDCSRPLDEVVRTLQRGVLEYLETRQQDRAG